MTYHAPVKDMLFVLNHLAGLQQVAALPGFEEATPDTAQAVLEESAHFAAEVLAPLNHPADREPSAWRDGAVTTAAGFKQAFRQYTEAGWQGMSHPVEYGGQGLPGLIGSPCSEMLNAANLSFALCPLLTNGAIEALLTAGSPELKKRFIGPMISGQWTGTMNLTEPQAGSDLAMIRTRAQPVGDGTYRLSGTKIFITAGEHDLTGNIVHLVLAKLPDAPAGAKGISLFVTPKFKVDRDGNVGERNALRCGSIEHKMGIKGSVTCVMNFDGAQGYLVGQPHKGLQAMFTMMNTARLGVGLQGIGLSERAYQNALKYSRERLQSRALSGAKFPDKPADPILVHPDVRRMLLTVKSLVEGSRLLALHAATLIDVAHHAEDAAERERADTLVSFLTPISKACQTEWGIENTYNALQCFGGHGYIREHGMEQLARDARITTLYEGTTGIQALDLIGRKTASSQGAGLKLMLAEIEAFAKEHEGNEALAEFIGPLRAKAAEWGALTMDVLKRASANPDELGAASYDYLFYSGYVVLAYWWARSVAAADASAHGAAFAQGKRETARFYFARVLPRTLSLAAASQAGAAPLRALADARFGA
ncbi:hypothetical protein G6F31_011788 [Rhizopus arrhizus]|nr:hypothetical protein G6F31_011788 [Rhizopus arrhizus]